MKISGKEAYSVMLSDSPDIMNIEEMCSALSISKKTGYKLLREGKIVGMKVGRTYRVPKVHVLSYLWTKIPQNDAPYPRHFVYAVV